MSYVPCISTEFNAFDAAVPAGEKLKDIATFEDGRAFWLGPNAVLKMRRQELLDWGLSYKLHGGVTDDALDRAQF